MAWSLTSPVTGGAQTGLGSPTYTLTADNAPSSNGKQHAVTALGGTQPNVSTTGASTPFTITMFKPPVLKIRTMTSGGIASSAPMNVYKVITRKGVVVDSLFTGKTMLITSIIEVPAGSELVDAANVRAALSLHVGALSQQSAGLGDTTVSGVF